MLYFFFFFFQAEDGIRDYKVTRVQTCALPISEATRGATIVVHLREGEDDYLEPARLRRIVSTYSDHIGLPIILRDAGKEETINTASALWTRTKSEITQEQYNEFYHHVGHSFDDPWLTLHTKAEGVLEY